MSDEISHAEVIRMIRNLVSEKGTATLYIRTDRNRVVMVAVKAGDIITLSSGPRHGEKAIPMLKEMRAAVVRIEESAVAFHSELIPPTRAILAMLEAENAPTKPEVATARIPGNRSQESEADKVRMVLGRLLTDYMGPVGPMVCDQFLRPLGNSIDADVLRATIEKIAAEIGDSEEARTFVNQAWKELHL